MILLNTDENASFKIRKGDRIAQMVVVPYVGCRIEEVEVLDETERGTGGFGSTGQK